VNYSLDGYTMGRIWSYRRSVAAAWGDGIQAGDISNQNWGPPPGNDYGYAYLLASLDATLQQRDSGQWCGGLNISSLAEAERTAYGWFTYFANVNGTLAPFMNLTRMDVVGTDHGLSKMPYVRDTRRSVGMNGFRLLYPDLASSPNTSSPTATHFPDTIAIGDYLYADMHHMATCEPFYPSYLGNASVKPFYIPYRALTNQDFTNLLVAGKTMAQRYGIINCNIAYQPELICGLCHRTQLSRQQCYPPSSDRMEHRPGCWRCRDIDEPETDHHFQLVR